jgi:hypothetical protein
MRWANLALPKAEGETDGGDDGKFHRACPRGGNIDLRQVCRDDYEWSLHSPQKVGVRHRQSYIR